VSGRGTASLAKPPGALPLRLAYKGTARLSNVHVLDSDGEGDLLKWQVLDLEGVDVKAGEGPPFVAVGKVTLSDFYARVIVSEKGRLNLADLVKRGTRRGRRDRSHRAGIVRLGQHGRGENPPCPRRRGTRCNRRRRAAPTIRIGAIEFVRGNVTSRTLRPAELLGEYDRAGRTVTALASDSRSRRRCPRRRDRRRSSGGDQRPSQPARTDAVPGDRRPHQGRGPAPDDAVFAKYAGYAIVKASCRWT